MPPSEDKTLPGYSDAVTATDAGVTLEAWRDKPQLDSRFHVVLRTQNGATETDLFELSLEDLKSIGESFLGLHRALAPR